MAYFIDYYQHNEVPKLAVFQNSHSLKARGQENSVGFYYFSSREKCETIIANWYDNLWLNRGKYIRVQCKTVDGGLPHRVVWAKSRYV